MSIKNVTLLCAADLLLLALLGIFAWFIRCQGFQDLLLVSSGDGFSPPLNLERLEEIAEAEFPLTYEIPGQALAGAGLGEHPVRVIGTNHRYPRLTAYPLLRGGFFTKAAEQGKRRQAVLNTAAAREIFGGDNITGKTFGMSGGRWLVAGVMEDGHEDEPRVYVPGPVRGEGPRSLLVLLREGVDEGYVKTILQALGVYEAERPFFNLAAGARLYADRFTAALCLFAGLVFFTAARRRAAGAKVFLLRCRRELKRKYPGDLIRNLIRNRIRKWMSRGLGAWVRFLLGLTGWAGGTLFCLSLPPRLLRLYLSWKDLPSLNRIPRYGDFAAKTAPLGEWYSADTAAFVLFLVLLVITAAALRPRRH